MLICLFVISDKLQEGLDLYIYLSFGALKYLATEEGTCNSANHVLPTVVYP